MIAIESLSPDLDRGFHCRVLVGSLDEAWEPHRCGRSFRHFVTTVRVMISIPCGPLTPSA